MANRPDPLGTLAGPLYFFAFMLVALPVTQTVLGLWPLRPGDVGWRFGAVGLITGAYSLPALAVVIAAAVAVHGAHARVQLALIVFLVVASLTILAVAPFFVLDALQLRTSLAADRRSAFDLAVANSLFVQSLLVAAALYLAAKLLRNRKRRRVSARDDADTRGEPNVIFGRSQGTTS